ncbi:S-norcoclaurine synthase 1-like isoform X2 [Momordica charantia]|uniref:S-norcoclaurine synthase 1-like isoform X2 n=1 Tax=Momordica charantia TaxID=3673 RepID=A0A6J1D3A9_MOMCH|nr:S-norcoclaurine synthase 1-like isoform X2 [Momordica charantia]
MVSEISDETEIQAPAARVWEEIYGGLRLGKFLPLHLPNLIEKVEVLEGDGGEGTLLHITFAPEMVEGGYLDFGFTVYRFRIEIIEKDEHSCIVKSTVEYELKEEAAQNISLATVQPLVAIAQAANNYFLNTQQPKDA